MKSSTWGREKQFILPQLLSLGAAEIVVDGQPECKEAFQQLLGHAVGASPAPDDLRHLKELQGGFEGVLAPSRNVPRCT